MRNVSFSNFCLLGSALLLGCLLSCNDSEERDNPMDPGLPNPMDSVSSSSSQLASSFSVSSSSSQLGSSSSQVSSSSSSLALSSSSSLSSSSALLSSSATDAGSSKGSMTDSRDNRVYRTVVIGTQTWMAENLAYLPSVNGKDDESRTDAKYYVYGYDGTSVSEAKATSEYTAYGVLYNWPAAMAACPAGWHLPSDAEWTVLETYVGGAKTAGIELKSVSGWKAGDSTGVDTYGFSALPGGVFSAPYFKYVLLNGEWWTATAEGGDPNADSRRMFYSYADVLKSSYSKDIGYSVRCLQD